MVPNGFCLTPQHCAEQFQLKLTDTVPNGFSLTALHGAQQFQSNYRTWSPMVSV